MDWVSITPEQLLGISLTTLLFYIGLLILVRLNGLRSFSKMSGHDFAITVAIGSIFASIIITKEPSLTQGLMGVFMLLLLQALFSRWRLARKKPFIENQPLLLMDGSKILHDNLKKAKVTENDLIAKLREANVININEVQAAILEVTGDVSILRGDKKIDPKLLQDVRQTP